MKTLQSVPTLPVIRLVAPPRLNRPQEPGLTVGVVLYREPRSEAMRTTMTIAAIAAASALAMPGIAQAKIGACLIT